jgi:hypothetical protein
MNNSTYAHRLQVLKNQRTAIMRAIFVLERLWELRLNRSTSIEALGGAIRSDVSA